MPPDFRHYHHAQVKLVAGDRFDYLEVVAVDGIPSIRAQAGVYVLLGQDNTIVHVGKAMRTEGVRARLEEHMSIPERRESTQKVVVVALDPLIPLPELLGIEGRVADLLRVRGRIPGKRWPVQHLNR